MSSTPSSTTGPSLPTPAARESAAEPLTRVSSLSRLVPGLILSPQSFSDHKQNLAKLHLCPELVLELEYRKLFPEITHERYVELVNDPDLVDHIRDEMRATEGLKNYVMILRQHADKAMKGNLASTLWYTAELGLSEAARIAASQAREGSQAHAKLIADLSKAVGEVMDVQKKKVVSIDAVAEVK